MKKYCPNTKAQKEMGSHAAGEGFDVEIVGDKAIFSINGVKRYEGTKDFFEDNFFPVEIGKQC